MFKVKKAVICLFAFTLIMSTDVLGNEYIEPNYFDAYSMVLNNNEISINGQNSKTKNFKGHLLLSLKPTITWNIQINNTDYYELILALFQTLVNIFPDHNHSIICYNVIYPNKGEWQ